MKISILALLVASVLSITAVGQKVQGVWALTEVTTTGTTGSTKQVSQPSLYIFTKTHYSIMYVSSDAPRPQIADASKATADQLRDVYVTSFVANAGTYEVKGGKLTMRPAVAKNPGFMQPGAFSTVSVKSDANTMTLVTESTNAGPVSNPTTFKLKRVE
jgi:hypothetical protein